MSSGIKEDLKERVLAFIEAQPGYDPEEAEAIKVDIENKMWSILYGESLEAGIAGYGNSPEDAFDDFIVKWQFFKGFEWIKKTHAALK